MLDLPLIYGRFYKLLFFDSLNSVHLFSNNEFGRYLKSNVAFLKKYDNRLLSHDHRRQRRRVLFNSQGEMSDLKKDKKTVFIRSHHYPGRRGRSNEKRDWDEETKRGSDREKTNRGSDHEETR